MKFYVFRIAETFHRYIAIPAVSPRVASSILETMSPEALNMIDTGYAGEETALIGEFDWEEEEK